jgi:uncharacterized protein YabN with tetrapyrrole methylase and pyrophosphatase domain
VEGPAAKVDEEIREVRAQLQATPVAGVAHGEPPYGTAHSRLEEELGDLLFAVVNLCRKAGVHASLALDRANEKFVRRFSAVEALAESRGIEVGSAGLEVLDALWDEVKRSESA